MATETAETATLVAEDMGWWMPVTNLYHLSTPLDGYWYLAVTVPAHQFSQEATVHLSNAHGVTLADPGGNGLVAQRRYDGLDHTAALAELGYEVVS